MELGSVTLKITLKTLQKDLKTTSTNATVGAVREGGRRRERTGWKPLRARGGATSGCPAVSMPARRRWHGQVGVVDERATGDGEARGRPRGCLIVRHGPWGAGRSVDVCACGCSVWTQKKNGLASQRPLLARHWWNVMMSSNSSKALARAFDQHVISCASVALP
jgi:hypothetical protein